jgi:hypothetical protein
VAEDGKRLRGTAKALAKKRALSRRALREFEAWLKQPAQQTGRAAA